MGHGHFAEGNLTEAIECYQKAIEVSADPFYSQWPRVFLGNCLVQNGQIQEAEEALREVISYSQSSGVEIFGTVAFSSLGIILIMKGDMSRGLKMLEEVYQSDLEKEYRWGVALLEYILGKVYFQIVKGAGPVSLSAIAKKFVFLVKKHSIRQQQGGSLFQ